jgi:hypothetical protein
MFKIKAFLDSLNGSTITEKDTDFPVEASNSKSISGYLIKSAVA